MLHNCKYIYYMLILRDINIDLEKGFYYMYLMYAS